VAGANTETESLPMTVDPLFIHDSLNAQAKI